MHSDCQFNNNCGGMCETAKEIEYNLCADCLDAHHEREIEEKECIGLLSLVADIREAVGDKGKMMQPELVEYIRGLKNEVDLLKTLLTEAANDLNEWGDYVPEYFRDKHNLKADIEKYREAGK